MNRPRECIGKVAFSVACVLVLLLLSLAIIGSSDSFGAEEPPSGAPGGVQATAAADFSALHVPNRLLVKLASDTTIGATAALAAAGMEVVGTIPQLELAVVETAPGADLAAAAADLAEAPAIEWAEPNYLIHLDSAPPNDPYYASSQAPYLSRLQMPDAWDYTIGSPDVVIAIVDTGVNLSHADLADGIWTNSAELNGKQGVDDDGNGFVDDVHGWNFADNNNSIADDHGHGTHVAGIAAARINNGIGIAGMAGGCKIMPLDVFNSGIGTYESLIRAIVYATDNGARVINMSLGAASYSRGEQAAVDYAWSHGVVLAAAAGNTGRNTYNYPAAHPHVIAVAATDASDRRASFSTYADFVDVAAPGLGVLSSYGSGYTTMSGTSMATPHVSGLAALILSLNPDLTPDQVRNLIEQNADDLGAAGWDPYFGHGRINALRTLAQVTPNPNPSPTPTPGPPLEIWPAGCQELIPDGDFETWLGGWQASGSAEITDTLAYSGTRSAYFPGVPGSRGVLTRTLDLPSTPMTGTLWFAYRIATSDSGYGSSAQFPYDDWLTVEFRSPVGQLLQSLLSTGNSADTSNDGLPWDQYVYRMQPVDFAALGAATPVNLVFTAGNDGDSLLTRFWVDAVRFCAAGVDNPSWPDLVAGDLRSAGEVCGSAPEYSCNTGDDNGVRFTVANQGQANASDFYVRVSTEGAVGDEWHVTSLPAGESKDFTWGGVAGLHAYTGTVDEQNMVVESDETNNQITRELQVEPTCTPTPTPEPRVYRVILFMVFQDAPLPASVAAGVPTGTPALVP